MMRVDSPARVWLTPREGEPRVMWRCRLHVSDAKVVVIHGQPAQVIDLGTPEAIDWHASTALAGDTEVRWVLMAGIPPQVWSGDLSRFGVEIPVVETPKRIPVEPPRFGAEPTVEVVRLDAPDLEAYTVAELRALARERGVEVPSRALKADLVEALSGR